MRKSKAPSPKRWPISLNDSPMGLLSWIVEKFYAWSDNDGNIEHTFTKDDLPTNVVIYWVTQSIDSSVRLCYETMGTLDSLKPTYVKLPTGFAVFS